MNIEKKLVAGYPSPVSFRSIILTDWKWCLSGAIFSFLLASVLMTGWPTGLLPNLDYPYSYSGDGLSYSWLIQRAIEGWTFDNPRSGYPFGSNFLDYPGSDSGNYLILKLIGLLTGEYHSALNLYFLFGFTATFIASFCVLRKVGLVMPFAFSAAILFNFLPFHFLRLEHLFYTWYFVVPVFYYIALKIFDSKLNENDKTNIFTKLFYAICLMILGSFGVYYALFGLIILFVAAIPAVINKNKRALRLAFFVSCFVIIGVLSNLAPNLIYQHINGPNTEVGKRNPSESEIYGFKFAQLVLPRPGHRIEKFKKITNNYNNNSPIINENFTSGLGIVGSLGIFSLFFLISSVLSGNEKNKSLKAVALIVLVLFMFGTIGGFGSIFAMVVTPSFRGWSRISVFIGFGALLGLFIIIQDALSKRFSGHTFAFLSYTIAIIFLIGGIYDQTVSANDANNEQISKSFRLDKDFIHSIENTLPAGSPIYQLPYMPFPETAPLYRLHTYDLAAGFLHSSSLRWSYAGMKGRSGDFFYRSLAQETIEKQLDVIKRLGFAGIYIDKRGFEDNGQSLIDALTTLLGGPPALIRADGEVAFFRLDQKPSIDLEGLSTVQLMQKAGYIADHLGVRYDATFAEGIDFARRGFPVYVKNIRGLSGPEPWGRWSDANLSSTVRIDFLEQLPNRFDLVLTCQAFGPNMNQELKIRTGSQTHGFKMKGGVFEYHKLIDLAGEKVTRIEFVPPQPASPQQLGISADSRRLGIGFVRLHIKE